MNSPTPEQVAELSKHLRTDYDSAPFTEDQASQDPFQQFLTWFQEATERETGEANAMTVSTVDPNGRPSSRVVLLKEMDGQGFVFYSNTQSRKGNEIKSNPAACILFYWPALQRQIRIEGRLEAVAPETADTYFASRPRSAQIGAWASQQSRPVGSREEFQEVIRATADRFGDESQPVPRPPHWSGYRCIPEAFEFWQGQPSRLHDRLHYQLQSDGTWLRQRLMP